MLKSHRNLLEPHPSDRLRIGDRVVDIPLREIVPLDGGEPVRVTLKSLGVLLVLVAHAGRPVSREALLEWVWPDTLPTDDVITQAITQLRKALGDDRERPRYIETLAKQGYRLIAPIEWLVERESEPEAEPEPAVAPASTAASASSLQPSSPNRPRRLRTIVGLVAATAVAVAAFVLWRGRDAAESAPPAPSPAKTEIPVQRIASSPQREETPALSPDGALVAYALNREDLRGSALMLQTAAAVPPRPLTELVEGRWDAYPAWSPNGREIVFLRSTDNDCRLMLIPATGGAAREIGDCIDDGMPVGWYPDGKALVGSGRPAAGDAGNALHRLTLDEGRWRPIAYERLDEDIDIRPQVSPDGRWIAFQRNLSLGDVWRIPVAGGKPQRLTSLRTNLHGIAWTPDSRGVVFARYRSDGVVLARLDIASGALSEYRSGSGGLGSPSVAADGEMVAFVIEESQSQLRALRVADGARAFERAEVVFPSSRTDILPAVSPDGREILYVSDRDGRTRLWWAELDRPESLRPIEGFEPMPRFPAMWHPDSARALVIGDSADGRKTAYEIEPRQGRVRRLEVPDAVPVHLAYHPDPDRILVIAEREQGRLGLILYDRSVRPWRALAQIDDAVLAFADPVERRVVFVRTYKPSIWQVGLDLRDPRQIDEVRLRPRIRTLTPTADGVWVMDYVAGCEWHWRRVNGAGPRQARCLGDGPYLPSGVSFDARSGRLFAGTPSFSGLDIGLLPLSAFDSAQEGASQLQ